MANEAAQAEMLRAMEERHRALCARDRFMMEDEANPEAGYFPSPKNSENESQHSKVSSSDADEKKLLVRVACVAAVVER